HSQRLHFHNDFDAIDIGIWNAESVTLFNDVGHIVRSCKQSADRISITSGVIDRGIAQEWPLDFQLIDLPDSICVDIQLFDTWLVGSDISPECAGADIGGSFGK